MIQGRNTIQNEMFYVLFRLKSNALGHIQLYIVKNYLRANFENRTKIVAIQNLAYANLDLQGIACRVFIDFYQIHKKFATFWVEFHQLSQKAGIIVETILKYRKNRLSNEIKAHLVIIDDSQMTLKAFIKVV